MKISGRDSKVTIVNLGTSKTKQVSGALKLYRRLKTTGKASLDGGPSLGLSLRPWRRAVARRACQKGDNRRKSAGLSASVYLPARRVGSILLRRIGVLVAVIVLLFALGRITSVVVDWAWFSSIGYVSVFWTAFAAKAALFVVVFTISTLFLWANATLALRSARKPRARLPAAFDPYATVRALPGPMAGLYGLPLSPSLWRLLIFALAFVLGLFIAMGETGSWDLILRFVYHAPYGGNDPLFDKDIGFYLFSLPVYVAVKNLLLWILLLAALMAGAIYFLHDDISLDPPAWSVSPSAIAHCSVLLGLYFAVKAWSYVLDRYLLLYNDNGVVVGAGYTDVHVELPALWLLIGLAAVAAIAAWANVRLRRISLVIAAPLLVFGGSFLVAELILDCLSASSSSRTNCSWRRRTFGRPSPSRGKPTTSARSR